jgi:chromosomal replication initiation ATPase DnaA
MIPMHDLIPDVKIILAKYHTRMEEVKSYSRRRNIIKARKEIIWLLHDSGHSVGGIGRRLGRDHSTISHHIKARDGIT